MAKILRMRPARKPVETQQRIRASMEEKQATDEKTADRSTTAVVVTGSFCLAMIALYIVKFYM